MKQLLLPPLFAALLVLPLPLPARLKAGCLFGCAAYIVVRSVWGYRRYVQYIRSVMGGIWLSRLEAIMALAQDPDRKRSFTQIVDSAIGFVCTIDVTLKKDSLNAGFSREEFLNYIIALFDEYKDSRDQSVINTRIVILPLAGREAVARDLAKRLRREASNYDISIGNSLTKLPVS